MSTAAIPVHVALVDMTGTIKAGELARVAGALNEQILDGGYISFEDPTSGDMWQRFVVKGKVVDRQLQPPPGRLLGLREFCDEQARAFRDSAPGEGS